MIDLDKLLDNDRIKMFMQSCQNLVTAHRSGTVLELQEGRKFFKIVETHDNGKSYSVFAFVDKVTGDIFKPASYKIPAKHPRGNINDDTNGMGRMTPYGPEYLK